MPEYPLYPQYKGNSLINREKEYLHTKYIRIKTTPIVISGLFKAISVEVFLQNGTFIRGTPSPDGENWHNIF